MIETKDKPANYRIEIKDEETIATFVSGASPFTPTDFDLVILISEEMDSDLEATEALDEMTFTLASIVSPTDGAVMEADKRVNPLFMASERKTLFDATEVKTADDGLDYHQVVGITTPEDRTENDTFTLLAVDVKLSSKSAEAMFHGSVEYEPFALPDFYDIDRHFDSNPTLQTLH